MTAPQRRLCTWTPRVLGLLFAGFLGVFALDVFGEGASVGQTLVALAMHLIPTALVLAALAVAWRWPGAGAVGFLALAGLYVWLSGGHQHPTAYALIAGPPVLLAALFALDAWLGRPDAPRPGAPTAGTLAG